MKVTRKSEVTVEFTKAEVFALLLKAIKALRMAEIKGMVVIDFDIQSLGTDSDRCSHDEGANFVFSFNDEPETKDC